MPGVKKPKPLTASQLAFCRAYVVTPNGKAAYTKAYGVRGNAAEVNASRLLRNAKVVAEIERLRLPGEKSTHLTLAEKRDFLAGVLRTPIGDIDHTSVYCQERTYIDGKEESSIKIKGCDKLRALELDSRLNGDLKGDNAGDAPVYSTPAELVEVLKLQALALWGREEDVRLARAAVTRR